ncbi:MAG: class II SORL domain-containing protein [Myxococcota bacterium]
MSKVAELFQSGDWKAEKHVPVIAAPDTVAKDELFTVELSVGKEIPHPNTTEHHIRWIKLYFKPEGDKFSYEVGSYEFTAHGESVEGANKGPVYTHPVVTASLKVSKGGTLVATSFCNIHGLWESSKELKLKK